MSEQHPDGPDSAPDPRDDSSDTLPPLDRAMRHGFGAADPGSVPTPSESVLGRISERIGSEPRVSLRETDRQDYTPMLKPLGPDETRDAGKYLIHGELGRGGVGTVLRGHDRDLGRDVAMKFLHERYKDEPSILHRFVEEAQIGGQLQHPGIVPVYDLGMSNGQPFFAMKLVKGSTLAKVLAERESPASNRRHLLSVFEQICQTMAYAHARGVVHRDLKPGNVMIGSFGEVQVVDWGMGKVMPRGGVADEQRAAAKHNSASIVATVRSAGHGTQSVMGSVMGTPAYMPPEQARGDVEAMDERSDVFALGAILCEILTGLPPYIGAQADLIAMAAMARLDDAHARLRSCNAEPALVDLATQCLMPAPDARPRTAEAVAKTIHDHLANLEARVHTARVEAAEAKVRTAALKRQQKLGAALLVTIAIGLAGSVYFWRDAETQRADAETAKLEAQAQQVRAEQQEAEAKKQEAEAKQQAAIAEAVAEFQAELLASVDPHRLPVDPVTKEPLKDAVTVAQVMAAAVELLDQGILEGQPLVEAGVRLMIGDSLRSLARFEESELLLRRSVALMRAARPAGDPAIANCLRCLGQLLADVNRLDEAEPLLREALAILQAAYPEGDKSIASMQRVLAGLLKAANRLDEAESLARETLELDRACHPGPNQAVSASLNMLAQVLVAKGKLDEVEPLLRESLAIVREVLPAGRPAVANALANVATFLVRRHRLDEAEPMLREALAIERVAFPAGHPKLAVTLSNLGMLLSSRSQWAEAEACLREALAIQRVALPAAHPDIASILTNLGALLRNQNRLAEAEAMVREALAMSRVVHPGGHPNIGVALHNLALIKQALGELDEAEAFCRESLAIKRANSAEPHPDTVTALSVLGAVLLAKGEVEKAGEPLREAVEMCRLVYPAGHPGIAQSLHNLGVHWLRQSRLREAEPLIREAVAIARVANSSSHPETAVFMGSLGEVLMGKNEIAEAEALFREEVAVLRKALPSGHPYLVRGLKHLLQLLQEKGLDAESEPLAREVLGMLRATLPAGHPKLVEYIDWMVGFEARLGRVDGSLTLLRELLAPLRAGAPAGSPQLAAQLASYCLQLLRLQAWDEAEPLLRECLGIRERLDPDDWSTFSTRSMLGQVCLGQGKLAEAETLLLAGYEGLKQRESSLPRGAEVRLHEALERLVKLCEAKGDEAQAAMWREQLAAARAATPAPVDGVGK